MKARQKNRRKKELLSYDNAVRLIAILLIIAVVRAAITSEASKPDLEQEAEYVLKAITDENMPVSVLSSNEVVEEKVIELHQMGYNNIKSMLGVKNDFCIYFEDISGNVIRIDGVNLGIGSNRILINGEPCK